MRDFYLSTAIGVMCAVGCSTDTLQEGLDAPPTGRAFGGPVKHEALSPYQGNWRFVSSRTDPELAQAAISGGPDILIRGHIIRFDSDIPVSELRLCQIRETDTGIEAEAWSHEDINDPGDMHRADCVLKRNGEELELRWRIFAPGRMSELSPSFSDDPVIAADDYVPPGRTYGDPGVLPWWIKTYTSKTISD